MAKAPDFFKEETQAALNAIKRRSVQTLDSLKKNTDLRPWIRQRPKASLAAAAAGGLVAGYLLTPPRKSEQQKQRERAVRAGRPDGRRTFSSHLESEVFRAIRPALRAFAASAAGVLLANVPLGQHVTSAIHGKEPAEDLSGIPRQGMQL
jgi:hypothetical protein